MKQSNLLKKMKIHLLTTNLPPYSIFAPDRLCQSKHFKNP